MTARERITAWSQVPQLQTIPEIRSSGLAPFIGKNQWYQLIQDGELKATKVAGRWVVSRQALQRLLDPKSVESSATDLGRARVLPTHRPPMADVAGQAVANEPNLRVS